MPFEACLDMAFPSSYTKFPWKELLPNMGFLVCFGRNRCFTICDAMIPCNSIFTVGENGPAKYGLFAPSRVKGFDAKALEGRRISWSGLNNVVACAIGRIAIATTSEVENPIFVVIARSRELTRNETWRVHTYTWHSPARETEDFRISDDVYQWRPNTCRCKFRDSRVWIMPEMNAQKGFAYCPTPVNEGIDTLHTNPYLLRYEYLHVQCPWPRCVQICLLPALLAVVVPQSLPQYWFKFQLNTEMAYEWFGNCYTSAHLVCRSQFAITKHNIQTLLMGKPGNWGLFHLIRSLSSDSARLTYDGRTCSHWQW